MQGMEIEIEALHNGTPVNAGCKRLVLERGESDDTLIVDVRLSLKGTGIEVGDPLEIKFRLIEGPAEADL